MLADSDSDEEVISYLQENFGHVEGPLSIVIDYSSMSRVWYSAILRFFYFNNNIENEIKIFCCYSIAKFSPSIKDESYNLHIGPIRGFSSLSIPQKPTALVIGLGYEKNRAIGLNEYFDGETFVFHTDASVRPEFSQEVKSNNSLLLNQLKKENICLSSITDLNGLYRMLFSLCNDLEDSYRVIIASCGPKSFTLISLIVGLELRNISVWRISAGKGAIPTDKAPEGKITTFSISFKNQKEQIISLPH